MVDRFESNLSIGEQLVRLPAEPAALELFCMLTRLYQLQKVMRKIMRKQPLLRSEDFIELSALWKYNTVNTERAD